MNEGSYTDPELLQVVADAMSMLHLLSADLSPHPIRLVEQWSVIKHGPHAARTRKKTV